MGKALKRLATRLALALGIVLAAYAGWKGGDVVFPHVDSLLGIGERPDATMPDLVTPHAAELAAQRIEAFRRSADPELRLEPFEVSSLMRYAVSSMLPGGVVDPSVNMDGDRLEIHAGVVPSLMPSLPDLGAVVGILPDTVQVSVGGALVPFGDAGSMLLVQDILVKGIPIPSRVFPEILEALGRKEIRGLPPSAILVPAFTGIGGAYIEDGELVLVRA